MYGTGEETVAKSCFNGPGAAESPPCTGNSPWTGSGDYVLGFGQTLFRSVSDQWKGKSQ